MPGRTTGIPEPRATSAIFPKSRERDPGMLCHPATGEQTMLDDASLRYLASPAAISDLCALNALFIENFIRNDVKSHDAILRADFICVRSNGARMDRATYLKMWATGFDPRVIVYWDVRDELITLVGNVALVRATNKEIVRRDARDAVAMSTYTDIYVYERGAWKCIQAQITPVAPDQEPGDDTIVSTYINGVRTKYH